MLRVCVFSRNPFVTLFGPHKIPNVEPMEPKTVPLGDEATERQRAEATQGHWANSQRDQLETQVFAAWPVPTSESCTAVWL